MKIKVQKKEEFIQHDAIYIFEANMYIDICTHFPHIGRLRLQLITGNMCDERRMGKEKLILHFILYVLLKIYLSVYYQLVYCMTYYFLKKFKPFA